MTATHHILNPQCLNIEEKLIPTVLDTEIEPSKWDHQRIEYGKDQ